MDTVKIAMKNALVVLVLLGGVHQLSAQVNGVLTLDSCYAMARRNFPVVRQFGLIEKTKNYSLENVSKGYLPQVFIGGQATYQSDVTQPAFSSNASGNFPLFETISKDQYKIYSEVVQSVTDLFTLGNQKDLVEKNAEIETQKLEVELYKIRERIDQVYFGILMIEQQIAQTNILKKDIQAGTDKTSAAIANGTGLKSNLYLLQAEMLKADQRTTELKAARKSYADVLGMFIAQPVTDKTVIQKPGIPGFSPVISRPELGLFDNQKQLFDIRESVINARNLPRFSLFLQNGIGRPALNMLSDDFDFYYIGGLRLNWNLTNFYTSRREKEMLELSRNSLDVQKEVFLFNTDIAVKQQLNEIEKIEALIKTDNEIIRLREKIKETAQSQLSNGVISVSDYVTFVNAEDQARQNLLLHETQLLMVLYSIKTTTGN